MTTLVVRRLYVYAAAFLGLQLLAAGARGSLSVLLEQLFELAAFGSPALDVVRLSLNAALLVVGLPVWFGHWYWAQRSIHQPEEQRSGLRRLYGYLVLLVAVLGLLFAIRSLLEALFRVDTFSPEGARLASAIGALVVNVAIWLYHWRVLSSDRIVVEPSGAPATLRRWYLTIIQAVSLGIASFAAIDLLHRLLQLTLAPAIGSTAGVGAALASLLAGLAVWLPHHLWARALIRERSAIREDEAHSTLRQVYAALVVTAAAVAALGGLATLIYALLLATFGAAAWRSLLSDHTQALAVALIATPLWWYHRRQLTDEARLSGAAARIDTAQRMIGYLTAAIGLGALFFGIGGLIGTLLRLGLAPDVVGAGWRAPLSLYLALSIVAVPVYGVTAQALERRARRSPVEARTLARRIYLYAALLFGIVATLSTTVALLQLVFEAVLGTAVPDLPVEIGRWLGYIVVGAVIIVYHAMLLRQAVHVRGDAGAGHTIVVVADDPLRRTLVAAITREVPAATIHVAGTDEPASVTQALRTADVLVVSLQAALDEALGPGLRAFSGRRLLLATEAPGYELIGARTADTIARETARALRASLSVTPPSMPPSTPALPQEAT